MSYMGVKLTKNLFAKGITNSIKFVGGVMVGGITYFSFNKCCNNLKTCISESILCDPDAQKEYAYVDVEYTVEKIDEEFENEIALSIIDEAEEYAKIKYKTTIWRSSSRGKFGAGREDFRAFWAARGNKCRTKCKEGLS